MDNKKYIHVKDVDGINKFLADRSINPRWIEFISASNEQLGNKIKAKIKDHYNKENFNCKKCKSYQNGSTGSPMCPYFEWYDTHYTFDENCKVLS